MSILQNNSIVPSITFITMSTSQTTNLFVGANIQFNSVVFTTNSGTVSLHPTSSQITLSGSGYWFIRTQAAADAAANNTILDYTVFDKDLNVAVGISGSFYGEGTTIRRHSSFSYAEALLYVSGVSKIIEVRITGALVQSLSGINSGSTFISITKWQ